MTAGVLPVAILLASFVPAVATFFVPQESAGTRNALNLGGAVLKLALVVFMLAEVSSGVTYATRFDLVPGLSFLLRVDALSLLFLTLSAFLWLVTTVYAIAYLGDGPDLSRFFGFFSLCVTATAGIALAGSLVTFFIFYELLTLATWPLVVHKGDARSLAAGRLYLGYTLTGSAVLLVAIVWLEGATGPIEFAGADLGDSPDAPGEGTLRLLFVLFVAGLGVKAALVPLHAWLPAAMVAPAPVSALLHAVAVVKAGAFGIVRVVHDVFGFATVVDLGLSRPLAVVASITIVYGSLQALRQTNLKRRLAYSTVSQVSYIVLGVALATPLAVAGGLAHLVHQGLMKVTLFFCAGAFAERAQAEEIVDLDGIGRRMPLVATAFSVAALGMIGVPPVAGFVSKWYLGLGGLEAGAPWVLAVLAASALLNAAYFLPILHRIWYRAPAGERAAASPAPGLSAPPVVTALAALGTGLFAASALSPLGWAILIVDRFALP